MTIRPRAQTTKGCVAQLAAMGDSAAPLLLRSSSGGRRRRWRRDHDRISLRPGDRPGNDEHADDALRRARQGAAHGANRAEAILPATGLGRARPRRDLAKRSFDLSRSGRGCGRSDRSNRYRQPARDHGSVGACHGSRRLQRDRLARPAHCRIVRAMAASGVDGNCSPLHRLGCRPLFLGVENSLAARCYTRPAPIRRSRRNRLWHDRQLSVVAAVGRDASRDGCDQCRADHAVRHPPFCLGRRASRRIPDSARNPARGA